jgi:hypothetical protein
VTTTTPLERADELLRRMTVEEKAMQLSCVVPLAMLAPSWRNCASRVPLELLSAITFRCRRSRVQLSESGTSAGPSSATWPKGPRIASLLVVIGDALSPFTSEQSIHRSEASLWCRPHNVKLASAVGVAMVSQGWPRRAVNNSIAPLGGVDWMSTEVV